MKELKRMYLSNNNKLLILGFVAGLASAFLGVGGGVVIVPSLVLILDHDIKKTLGTSLTTITFAALAGGLIHYAINSANVRFDIAGVIFLGAIVGSCAGAAITKRVSSRSLGYMFAVLLLVVGLRQAGVFSFGDGMGVDLLSYPSLLVLGCIAGICSALFGIGGGVVVVPALNLFWGIPIHEAIATSLAVIVPTAAVGAVFHARYGHIMWKAVRFLVPAALAGAVLGALLSNITEPGLLKIIFSIYLFFCAVKLFLKKNKEVL
ncbi:MAG: sulfite exporter TauE/SafE family protein [Candidatus Tantalella remota]|nr:sulfite exporter TauE/SafE family protein [Candidatus Tantalella remota]